MSDFDEDQASASVPVTSVVVGVEAMQAIQNWIMFRAFHTRATSPGGMQMTRAFKATVKGFNEAYGFTCRNWSEVAEVTKAVYALRDEADKARRGLASDHA